MEIKVKLATSWQRVVDAARKTVGKESLGHDPKPEWRKRILISEHAPIRLLEYDIDIEAIRQWVTVHYVRHHVGIEKFVHSQREDRRELPCKRDDLPQGVENDMMYSCNAQAIINVSRKRLCIGQPSQETREVWELVKGEIATVDPELASAMVKECVYRGFCPEMKCCGYCFTKAYQKELEDYRSGTAWANYPKNGVKYYVGWKQKKSHGDYPAPKMKMRFMASNQDEYDRNLKMETFGCEDWSVREATKEEFIKSF